MQATANDHPQVPLRAPDQVMRLNRMGAAFPTRLSFMRILMRALEAGDAKVSRPVWDIDAQGFGRAVYSVALGGHTYSLIAFATPLADDKRTDRVIAEAWDASFTLFDGIPTVADLDRLAQNLPRQEAGRFRASELILSRANKSMRLFAHVVERLATGQQPDADMLGATGYLMRTTAVYGNGKMGAADRARIADRPALSAPFQAEMLTVWLIRGFTHDLVEHVARAQSPDTAVLLSRAARRNLGIGNSTGLGMAPFLTNHAALLNNWMMARETALARVCAVARPTPGKIGHARRLLARARVHVGEWNVPDARQRTRIMTLRDELESLESVEWFADPHPWARLRTEAAGRSVECQELINALLLEPNGDLVDDLAETMADNTSAGVQPGMAPGEVRALLDANYGWALDVDFSREQASALFWYVSVDKLEPRLGRRAEDAGADRELPLDIARRVQALARDLDGAPPGQSLPAFLLAHPGHRYMLRRVQISAGHPFSEIHDNLIAEGCIPLDILRFKLAFFGASKFDPKSDLWTRITLYQGAPLFDEIGQGRADDWWLPVLEEF